MAEDGMTVADGTDEAPRGAVRHPRSPKLQRLTVAALTALHASVASATAQTRAEPPLVGMPVYDAGAMSYFELVAVQHLENYLSLRNTEELDWNEAEVMAQRRVFHGVRGRLAVVKSLAVHEFLMRTFRPDEPAWIGLRYLCREQQLQWVTGEVMKSDAFHPWHPVWEQSGVGGCATQQYLTVMYTPVDEGFLWVTKGVIKEEHYYFVEYPTGGP
jgi:hypothetical protein